MTTDEELGLRMALSAAYRELDELRSNVHARDGLIEKMNDELQMAHSVIHSADETIKELQQAVTQIEASR